MQYEFVLWIQKNYNAMIQISVILGGEGWKTLPVGHCFPAFLTIQEKAMDIGLASFVTFALRL